jgi:hypothetical protein
MSSVVLGIPISPVEVPPTMSSFVFLTIDFLELSTGFVAELLVFPEIFRVPVWEKAGNADDVNKKAIKPAAKIRFGKEKSWWIFFNPFDAIILLLGKLILTPPIEQGNLILILSCGRNIK